MIISMGEQLRLFFMLIFTGIIAGFVYDLIRVLRRLIAHRLFYIQLEDLIFWLGFAFFAMMVLLWQDNGALRLFSLIAPILGLIFYFLLLSNFVFKPISFVALLVKRFLLKILGIICTPLTILSGYIKKCTRKIKKSIYNFYKNVKLLLKNSSKYAKISNSFLRVFYGGSKGAGSDSVERKGKKTK